MAYSIHNLYPKTFTRPDEAQQIEIARRRLVLQSEKVRTGHNLLPSLTALRLARTAVYFANSKAPAFERVHTLNAVEANFRARGVNERSIRTITNLSQRALRDAFPPAEDPTTRELDKLDVLARRRAIERTTPDTSFVVALDEAWTHLGHPIDTVIRTTERINKYGPDLDRETGQIEEVASTLPTLK